MLDFEGDFHAVLSTFFDNEWFVLERLEVLLAMECDGDVGSAFNLLIVD